MRKIWVLFAACCAFIACSHRDKEDLGGAGDKVFIRIINTLPNTLKEVTIGETDFGDVGMLNTTDYKLITIPVYTPHCSFKIDQERLSAGVWICGTPMPDPFAPGYYTFKIVPFASYYSVEMTKDR